MNDLPFTDADLRLAASDVYDAMLSSLPEASGTSHEFSNGFLEKMEGLLQKDARRRRTRSLLRWAAMIAAAVLVGAGVWLAADTEARAALTRWIREAYEDHVIYRFFGVRDRDEIPRYALTWIPDGFELIGAERGPLGLHLSYQDDEEHMLFFDCRLMDEGTALGVFYDYGEEDLREKVRIRGIGADWYPGDPVTGDMATLVWMDEDAGTMCSIESDLDRETILRIAENVCVDGPALPLYVLCRVPEGFVCTDSGVTDSGRQEVWELPDTGDRIFFTYCRVDDAAQDAADLSAAETVPIHGLDVWSIPGDALNVLIWTDGDAGLTFRLESTLDRDTTLDIAGQIWPEELLVPTHTLLWIPEGFTLVETGRYPSFLSLYYLDEADDGMILFQVCRESDTLQVHYDGGDTEAEQVRVGDIPADFYPKDDTSLQNDLIWLDGDAGLVYMLDSTLDKADMLRIAENAVRLG